MMNTLAVRAPQCVDTLLPVVAVTAVVGELPLLLWLLIKGVNVERWHRRALETGSP
jgi:hypothetical protein